MQLEDRADDGTRLHFNPGLFAQALPFTFELIEHLTRHSDVYFAVHGFRLYDIPCCPTINIDPARRPALVSPFIFKTVELRKGTALAQALRDTCL